jgi:hypothetical protein
MTNPDTTPDPPLPLPLPQHAWRHAKAKVEHAVADTPKDSARQRLVLGICVAVGFTTLLDQTIFALAVPRIQEALHATSAQLQLIVSIYSMMFGVALVPAGRLGDMIGRRPLFLLALAIFSGCSMLGGMATNATVVIVARLFQGLGAGMLNTQVLGLIQDQFQGVASRVGIGAIRIRRWIVCRGWSDSGWAGDRLDAACEWLALAFPGERTVRSGGIRSGAPSPAAGCDFPQAIFAGCDRSRIAHRHDTCADGRHARGARRDVSHTRLARCCMYRSRVFRPMGTALCSKWSRTDTLP